MSSNGDDLPDALFPDDVFAERNLQRRIENALGIDKGDLSADDTMEAASVYNLASLIRHQRNTTEALRVLSGQPVDVDAPVQVELSQPIQIDVQPPDVEPDVEVVIDENAFPDDVSVDVTIDEQTIRDAFIAAIQEEQRAVNRTQIYNVNTSGSSDNILTQPFTPQAESSSFRVTVTLDTAVTFSLRTEPVDDPNFTTQFNQGNSLNAGSMYEFQFDADPESNYNFRAGGAATVNSLRVQEVFVE